VRKIEAVAVVPAERERVFAFLSDLRNHWLVADPFVDVVRLGAAGGVVRISGPLGLRRTTATKVTRAEPPAFIAGTAEIGARTRAQVSWLLSPRGASTTVRLVAQVEQASALDRVLLALGGRAWLERRFAGALARLAGHLGAREAALGGPALARAS
jgi:hypothetical protein